MLRGGAAVAVMCAHASILGQAAIAPVVSDLPSLLTHIGSTSVWLFFILSGFVISRPFVAGLLDGGRLPSMRSYSVKRATRIYPLYWACALTVALLVGWGGAGPISRVAHSLLLHNLVPHRSHAFIAVSWTLTLEVIFYVAVPVAAFAVHRASGGRRIGPDRLALLVLVGWFSAIAFLALIPLSVESTADSLWLRGTFPSMVGMFAPGVLLAVAASSEPTSRIASYWNRAQQHPRAVVVSAVSFCALGAAIASIYPGSDTSLMAWDLSRHAYAIGYGLLVAWAAMQPRWKFPGVRVAEYLGDISYGVYLIHGTLLVLLLDNPSLIPMHRSGLGPYLVHLVFLATITLIPAAASWQYLESPINRRARWLAVKWSQTQSTALVRR